jgi:multidrug efflux pump
MGAIEDAFVMVLPPPPVNGLGTTGGFKMMIEDRGNLGYDELNKAVQAFMAKAWPTSAWPACSRATRSTCRSCSPTSTA